MLYISCQFVWSHQEVHRFTWIGIIDSEVMLLCCFLNIAMQGHDGTNVSGNFHEILHVAKYDSVAKQFEKESWNVTYQSLEFQNLLLPIIGNNLWIEINYRVQQAVLMNQCKQRGAASYTVK